MFLDIVEYFNTKGNCFISSCDSCGKLWAVTYDEVQVYENEKDNHTISGYVCPNCGEHLILPKEFDENEDICNW